VASSEGWSAGLLALPRITAGVPDLTVTLSTEEGSVRHHLRILTAVLALAGCAGPQAAPPSATYEPTAVTAVDHLIKPSLEPGQTVLGLLLRGTLAPGSQMIVWVQPYGTPFSEDTPPVLPVCSRRVSPAPEGAIGAKILDRLHPDAVQPALSVYDPPSWWRQSNLKVEGPFEGWLSFQFDSLPPGCSVHVELSARWFDAQGTPGFANLGDVTIGG
jgi:hypothetical protein